MDSANRRVDHDGVTDCIEVADRPVRLSVTHQPRSSSHRSTGWIGFALTISAALYALSQLRAKKSSLRSASVARRDQTTRTRRYRSASRVGCVGDWNNCTLGCLNPLSGLVSSTYRSDTWDRSISSRDEMRLRTQLGLTRDQSGGCSTSYPNHFRFDVSEIEFALESTSLAPETGISSFDNADRMRSVLRLSRAVSRYRN